ncbi:MAG: hypothetical protein V3W41_04725 [Planctomycetota bacterium]
MDCRLTRCLVLLCLMGGLSACQMQYDPAAERDAMMREDGLSMEPRSSDGVLESMRWTIEGAHHDAKMIHSKDHSVAPPFGHEVQHKTKPQHEGHFATFKGRGDFLSDDYPQGTHHVN